jgi:hypothetical protein
MCLFSWYPASGPARSRTILTADCLESRDVPSATLDLTTAGATGSINGALLTQVSEQPTGTGTIHSFVRVQALGNKSVEEGYNTDARPLSYDENNSPQFTRTLAVADTPVVTDANGTRYREFLLDVNQKASSPLLSLDALKVFVSDNAALSGKLDATGNLAGATLKYDLGAGNWVALNAGLNHGSGSGDMVLDVPESLLSGGSYLYLYSKFGGVGGSFAANGGFEEWAVVGAPGGAIADHASFSGRVFINSEAGQTYPIGARVQLILNGQVVDEAEVQSDGSFVFNNVVLEDTTVTFEINVDLTNSLIFGQYALSPESANSITLTANSNSIYLELELVYVPPSGG